MSVFASNKSPAVHEKWNGTSFFYSKPCDQCSMHHFSPQVYSEALTHNDHRVMMLPSFHR